MKAVSASIITVLLALLPLAASPADSTKTLQNMKGTVTYGPGSATTSLAVKASTTLSDNDYAKTGPSSLATITLPDSSQILMGSESSVQMASFNQTDIAHAKFVVVGKMRFTVNHPNGARADYQFSTATGQIAVRGTVGDILAQPGGGLQVNVYALSDPSLPVQVTLANGQVFTLAAGQSLVATAAAGAITASVTSVSQSMFTPFNELGAPANAASLGITATTAAATAAASAATTTAIAGAAAAAAVVTTIANSNHSSTPLPSPTATPTPPPTPTPSPQPSTTSVPITVNKATPPAVPGPPSPHLPGVRPTPGAR
ncbi:MAG TPA: FecR family protein [Candidatus Aquilonibacter sp.]